MKKFIASFLLISFWVYSFCGSYTFALTLENYSDSGKKSTIVSHLPSSFEKQMIQDFSEFIKSTTISDNQQFLILKKLDLLQQKHTDFEKAKILIAIQEIIDRNYLNDTKKQRAADFIEMILVEKTDTSREMVIEKLIRSLIPQESIHYQEINILLDDMLSHKNYDYNKELAKKVFELIIDDNSVELKHKQYIKNQLLEFLTLENKKNSQETPEMKVSTGKTLFGTEKAQSFDTNSKAVSGKSLFGAEKAESLHSSNFLEKEEKRAKVVKVLSYVTVVFVAKGVINLAQGKIVNIGKTAVEIVGIWSIYAAVILINELMY
ncbi:hypothetical protein CSB09_03385 [Candidatus Gracilibacteria bacterium]|nr:MAG: hypothetical protein CSB09_03385 [Candidatus Gracilibacteria bacterium]